jgi:hypothetical protein
VAGPIKLTETDFDQIKDNLVNYLKSTNKFTDYNFEASNLSVILNLIAYQAQLNSYNANMIANESFLTSAMIRKNVVANARQIGYLPHSATAANTEISFTFDLTRGLEIDSVYPGGLPSSLEIEPGTVFDVSTQDGAYSFSTIETYSTAVSSTGIAKFENVRIYEGTNFSITFTKDETDYNQKFVIENFGVDISKLRVEVQEDPNVNLNRFYKRANNITELDELSRVYWVEEVADGYELTFGDGLFGRRLADGAKIYVDYIITSGSESNGIRGDANYSFIGTLTDSFGNRIRISPTIDGAIETSGGGEIESIDSIKFRAPKSYAAQNRCVTAKDYDVIVREVYPAVDDVYVFGGELLEPAQYGRVFVAIKPKYGNAINGVTKNFIKESIDNYRIASLDVSFVDPEILVIEIKSLVYYDDRRTISDTAGIISQVTESIQRYADSDGVSRFGGVIRYSKIVGLIDDTNEAITRNVTELRIRKDITAVIDTAASYEICFENLIEIDYHNPVVTSTGFYILDSEEIHYIENNIPEVGSTVADLQLFYFDELNQKVVVDRKYGTFDLIKGEMMIGIENPITMTGTVEKQDLIKFRAKPKNNGQSIEAKKSVYLDFDISNSEISATVEGAAQ